MYGLRKTAEAREEAGHVHERHGSRKSGLPSTEKVRKSKRKLTEAAAPSPQKDLFG
jgi:hypothetical protein